MVLYKKVILKNFIRLQKNKTPLHLFSHLEVIYKKGVPKNLAKFAGKHLCQGLFLNKVAGLRRYEKTLLKKRLWHRCFHVNFMKLLRTPFYGTPPVVDSGFFLENLQMSQNSYSTEYQWTAVSVRAQYPAGISLLNVNNKNTKIICESIFFIFNYVFKTLSGWRSLS